MYGPPSVLPINRAGVGVAVGLFALNAAIADAMVAPSASHEATTVCPVIPPREKITTAARIPRTTITMRISSKVNPDSPIPSGAFMLESAVLVNHGFFLERTVLHESKCLFVQSGEWFNLALFPFAVWLDQGHTVAPARTFADQFAARSRRNSLSIHPRSRKRVVREQ